MQSTKECATLTNTTERTNPSLQRDLEVIHNRLAQRGIYPTQVEPGKPKRNLEPYQWGKT